MWWSMTSFLHFSRLPLVTKTYLTPSFRGFGPHFILTWVVTWKSRNWSSMLSWVYLCRVLAMSGFTSLRSLREGGGGEYGGVKEYLWKEVCGEWHACLHAVLQQEAQEKPSCMVLPQSRFISCIAWPQVYCASLRLCEAGAGPEKPDIVSPLFSAGTTLVHCATASAAFSLEVKPMARSKIFI